jgi:hypothetical protein
MEKIKKKEFRSFDLMDKIVPKDANAALQGIEMGTAIRGYERGLKKPVGSYKKGGKIKKTGLAKVHKGERVLNKKQASKFEKAKKKHFGIKKYGAN